MDRRKIFDTVVAHLKAQGKQAKNITGSCSYLTQDGLKCAIGCLIPDGHPAQISCGGVTYILLVFSDLNKLWEIENESDVDFLCALQEAHDCRFRSDSFLKLIEERYVNEIFS